MEMEKLKVFSKKFNKPVEVALGPGGAINVEQAWGWSKKAWANNIFQWLNGWVNGWSKQAWANTFQWMNGWANNPGNSSGCYITTACVEHMGLADDCDELQILRLNRDQIVKESDDVRKKVLEYYEKAPEIVKKINDSEDRSEILDDLYYHMICPCVELLKNGKTEEGFKLYLSYYESLVDKYLNPVDLKTRED